MTKYNFTIPQGIKDITLFNYLKYYSGISTRLFNKIKQSAVFYINCTKCNITSMVLANDIIEVEFEESSGNVFPEDIKLDIIFEDQHIIAINKPANMVTHPTCYHSFGTLANGVAFYFKSLELSIPVRPVIRLDKDTSGLIIFAKNAMIQQNIIDQMVHGNVKKTYIALVEGQPNPEEGTIDAPIARLPGSIITRHVSSNGASAMTHYKIAKKLIGYSMLELQPKTGRTHQIRVHMQHIGNPILGDTLYGRSSRLIERQALHAYRYDFQLAINNTKISIKCPLPRDIKILLS